MAKQQRYRLNNPAGSFPSGMIVTEADVRNAGFDFEFWARTNTLSKATDEDEQVEGADAILDDAAMKAEIEARIRESGVTKRAEQDQIAADVRRVWDDLREKRAARIVKELEASGGGQGKAGAEKPGPLPKLPPRGGDAGAHPMPAPAVNIGGNTLAAYDGKTDAQVLKMFPNGTSEQAGRDMLKAIRDAQRERDARVDADK